MGKHDPILKQTFSINNKPHSVWLFEHQITWCPQRPGGEDMSEWMSVKIRDIFSVEIEDGGFGNQNFCCIPMSTSKNNSEETSTLKIFYLMVYYAQRRKNTEIWECEAVKLGHFDPSILDQWSSTIQSSLNKMKHRPKNALILLNPFGGKQRSKLIFEESVKPILELAGVTWTLILTQHQNHATETLISMSQDKLFEYDVVVAVGGDGTACEVVTGLLRRSAETSASNKDTILQPSPLDIAVIPGGSSNALAFSVHGTDDPCTAAIHLVLGGNVPLDVGAIHDNQSGIARFFVTQVSYGHLADTLSKSDKLRWMGPRRYDYAGMCKFLNNKAYEGSLEIRLAVDDSRKVPSECGAGTRCEECFSRESLSTKEPLQSEWKKVEGKFLGVSAANISCRCALCPRGLAPFAHLSDGNLDVIVIRKASRINHLQYLMRIGTDSRTSFQLPFVERYRAKEIIFTPISCCSADLENRRDLASLGSSSTVSLCGCDTRQLQKIRSCWNCDGELHRESNIRITVHTGLIRIMARSSPEIEIVQAESSPTEQTHPDMAPLPTDIPIV